MVKLVRYALPAVIVLAGLVLLILNGFDHNTVWGATAMLSAGLSVFFLNWLFRLGASGDRERDKEAEARRFLAEHGHWPDEDPSQNRRA